MDQQKSRPHLSRFELIELLSSHLSYLVTLFVILILIFFNHSEHSQTYIQILKDLILIGTPSPLFKR